MPSASRGSNLSQGPRNCCSRLRWELGTVSWFGLEEPNGKTLDVQASFAPEGRIPIIVRAIFFLWSVVTLAANLIMYPEDNLFIFMGYLTHWTWILTLAYQLVALGLVVICKKATMQPPSGGANPGFLVKLLWILYSIATPAQIIVILLYWSLDYEGQTITYFNIMKHGIIGLLLFLDGVVWIALIPVRIKHMLFFEIYTILFAIWSYFHSYYEIGNGTFEDDTLYDVLNWKENPTSALILSLVVVFGLGPVCYLAVWGLSLLSWIFKCDGSRRPTTDGKRSGGSSKSSDRYQAMA